MRFAAYAFCPYVGFATQKTCSAKNTRKVVENFLAAHGPERKQN
jgi:hypothetical protein